MEDALSIKKSLMVITPSTLLIVCLVGLAQLSETIYSPALPAITQSLETTNHLVQWSFSIYFVGFALGVVFWGKVSDHIGRRPTILAGILLYIFMSFACNNASTITYLLIARFFQAFAVSVGSVVTQAMMRDCFIGIERNKIFSIVSSVIALALVIGPLMGGYLTQSFSWRANFICLTLMGMLLLIYAWFGLPETRQDILDANPEEDPPSLLQTATRMLKDPHVMASAFLVGGFNGILFSNRFNMLGIFMAVGVCVGSLISHRINHRVDTIKLIKFSCYSLLTLMAAFTALVQIQSISIIMTFMMLFYVCFGICIPNLLSKGLAHYQHHLGTASSIFGFISIIWVALFIFGIESFLPNSLFVMPVYFLGISAVMAVTVNFLRP